MRSPLAIFGIDVGDVVEDAIRALVDLVVPDVGSEWVSQFVVWLVALPPVTGDAFPSLNRYAAQLTAVGFGLLGACFIGGLLQLWAGGLAGMRGAGESLKRVVIAAGALVSYPVVLDAVLVGTNVISAQMIRHPLVEDGLDKAFGGALVVAAVGGGLSLGLAVGAAVVVLYFLAALVVMKIGLTTALSVAHVAGALVWGVYPLPQAAWLARAWTAALVAALVVPIAWACVFATAALLSADTLVFDGGGRYNQPLGEALQYLVKPLAAVACFWLAYRTPGFLLGLARSAGVGGTVLSGSPFGGGRGRGATGSSLSRFEPQTLATRAVRTNADRFRALTHQARSRVAAGAAAAGVSAGSAAGGAGTRSSRVRAAGAGGLGPLTRANRWWRALPDQGRASTRRPTKVRRERSGRSSAHGPRSAPAAMPRRQPTPPAPPAARRAGGATRPSTRTADAHGRASTGASAAANRAAAGDRGSRAPGARVAKAPASGARTSPSAAPSAATPSPPERPPRPSPPAPITTASRPGPRPPEASSVARPPVRAGHAGAPAAPPRPDAPQSAPPAQHPRRATRPQTPARESAAAPPRASKPPTPPVAKPPEQPRRRP